MSAIAGLYNLNDEESVSIEQRNGMMKALERFPADDIRVWQKGPVFLGCHAQWITPESIGEQLPFYDSERKCAITADSIIDNREELFEALQVGREDQKIIPDSLLILLAYYKWGEDCPRHLIGDFAFMIWDERERKFFGARDFSGTRTLYYTISSSQFAFCSTMEPLIGLPGSDKRLHEQWLAQYLAISVPVDAVDCYITPYASIKQIPPSHSFSVREGRIRFNQYCTLTPGKRLKLKSDDEYVEAFRDVFQKAITSRLRTFRGVGSQLSGGLDSGSIVSFAVKALKGEKQLHTFSYIPPNDFVDFTSKYLLADERPFIHKTVQHVGGVAPHYLDLEGKNPFTEIDDVIGIIETPYKFFQAAFWVKGIFEKAKEENVGIVLSGARGNVGISWGPALDYYSLLLRKMKWFRLISELNQYSQKAGGSRRRTMSLITRTAFPILDRLFSSDEPTETEPQLINHEFARRSNVYHKLSDYGIDETGWLSSTNVYEQRRRHFQDVFHWDTTNKFTAKLSLVYGLQFRDPSNDLRVLRFCLSVPEEQYVQKGLDRALLRRATEKYLPDGVRLNQSYRGIQGADWVHRMAPYWEAFLSEVRELIKDERILEYVDGQVIKEALSTAEIGPQCNNAFNIHYVLLMRSVVLYRYLKKSA
ncbi:asparagine synthase-related protein [Alicyclobacillus ferrooxydans]|uniref:asparagine synthase (glutamine-hydrolyzing) n=1 Tax=Alicyclobacillus ferrooxydans TaxID=471514 RepID=A0A0N8PMP8_9BACL|nr:asparagine synthase-related protein [Alicyclobacillus ferrooxydans]KPV39325.1 asparagine synthase [Alicyclobacillus ferrooxydans]